MRSFVRSPLFVRRSLLFAVRHPPRLSIQVSQSASDIAPCLPALLCSALLCSACLLGWLTLLVDYAVTVLAVDYAVVVVVVAVLIVGGAGAGAAFTRSRSKHVKLSRRHPHNLPLQQTQH